MFFSRPKSVLLLSNSGIYIYPIGNKYYYFQFPESLAGHFKVNDPDDLASEFVKFLQSNGIQIRKATLLLDSSILFSQENKALGKEQLSEKLTAFMDNIPLDSSDILYKAINLGTATIFLATSNSFLKDIVYSLNGMNLTGVYPAEIFEEFKTKAPPATIDLKKLNRIAKKYKSANFAG